MHQPNNLEVSKIKQVFKRSLLVIRKYTAGAIYNAVTIELMKNIFAENRPQFLDTCRPDRAVNCNVGEFIHNYECTNTEYRTILVREANHSFPSGHAALSFYVSLFMVWYLHYRCKDFKNQYLLKLLYLAIVTVAVFCSVSRVVDRRHYWWDVLGGTFLGIFFTIYTVGNFYLLFRKNCIILFLSV